MAKKATSKTTKKTTAQKTTAKKATKKTTTKTAAARTTKTKKASSTKTTKKSVATKTTAAKKVATAKKTASKAAEKKKAVVKKPAAVKKDTATKTQKTSVKITMQGKTTEVPAKAKKPETMDFVAGDFVVYPAHGVGQVEGVETQSIGGLEITLYTIAFEKDRMRLKLPITKAKASGLRKLSSKDRLKDALSTLQGRSQVRRIMWSRRAQEYEAKINSGDPVSIAEVLRDLKKNSADSEQSYSERQIYQAALERLAREVAAIEKIDEKQASEKLEAVLSEAA